MAAQPGNLELAPFFVMRTPLLAFEEWVDWSDGLSGEPDADRALLWSRLRDVFARPICRQAMFFAAPRVEAELSRLDETGEMPDDKLLRTLVRYFARMTWADHAVRAVRRMLSRPRGSAVCAPH
jgi:hypothetical protein